MEFYGQGNPQSAGLFRNCHDY